MLDLLFFGTLVVGVMFTMLTAVDKLEIAWPIMASISWFILSGIVANLSHVFAFLQADDTVATYLFDYSGGVFLMYFFAGIAVVFVIITIMRALLVAQKEAAK